MKKFEFVVQDILSKIYQGVITDKLPAERELAESYAVSRFTVRKALNKLEAIGAVFVRQGAGHFVKDANRNNPLVITQLPKIASRRCRTERSASTRRSPTHTTRIHF